MSPRSVPAAVFWRRRLLFVAVLIALVWVVLRVVDSTQTADAPAAEPTAPAPVPSTTPAAADGPLDVAVATASEACDPQKVRVTPSVRPKQSSGGAVQIALVVSSTETKPCTLQPGDADLVAIISANDTPIWDSTLCPTSLLTEPVELSPRWATFEVTTWSGRVSGSNCSSKQPFAAAGKYLVQAGTLGGEPGKFTFSLAKKPAAAKPSATPSEKPSATPTED